MTCPFKLPVSLTKDLELLDADGQVLIPTMLWRSDVSHVQRQTAIAVFILQLVNDEQEKRKGNPLFQKGKPNPYMHNGGTK